jgi:two-component system, OmpR family, response regulator MtrA
MTDVLVVDDEDAVRALLRDLLELEGYSVREAPDGPTALAAVDAAVPDVVVLDVMMPGLSGLDVLAVWRDRPELSGMPVLMLTAAADDETTWAGWAAGASCYLPKPFDPDHLLQWVERLLSDRPLPSVSDPAQAAPGEEERAAMLAELRDLADG